MKLKQQIHTGLNACRYLPRSWLGTATQTSLNAKAAWRLATEAWRLFWLIYPHWR